MYIKQLKYCMYMPLSMYFFCIKILQCIYNTVMQVYVNNIYQI